jgi:hypothetical protein
LITGTLWGGGDRGKNGQREGMIFWVFQDNDSIHIIKITGLLHADYSNQLLQPQRCHFGFLTVKLKHDNYFGKI